MSREGRAAYSRRTNKAAQRQFGHTKPRLQPIGTDTLWVAEFLRSAEHLVGTFGVNSIIALPLGDTAEERELKLRKASNLGYLHMSVLKDDDGVFIEYRWELTGQRPVLLWD